MSTPDCDGLAKTLSSYFYFYLYDNSFIALVFYILLTMTSFLFIYLVTA